MKKNRVFLRGALAAGCVAWFGACNGAEPIDDTGLAPAALSDPGPPSDSQCGPGWDLQHVESYNGSLGVSQAFVAQHQRRVGYHASVGCSGTLISKDLFLSAGHCNYQVGHTVKFNYQNAPDGTPRPTRDVTVTAVVEQELSPSYDYAIVRLSDEPGREFGHASIAYAEPPAGSMVAIIQHPAGQPKQVHVGTVLDSNSNIGANWFRHLVDTVGGSSGAGVLNAAGQLVGVHTNAGCNTSPAPTGGNSAISMNSLINHSWTLRSLVRGSTIVSDRNPGLGLAAWGGAQHGAAVRLSNLCSPGSPHCTWTYRDGMLLSDQDQRLAINAWGGAANGTELRLSHDCHPGNPDCTWTLKNGMFHSDRNPALAINAWGGAVNGAAARLSNICTPSNPDCTWTYRNVMMLSQTDTRLAANAFNGVGQGVAVRLHDSCDPSNGDCTWTIRRGRISSDSDPTFVMRAWDGIGFGSPLKLDSFCPTTNPDCSWTIRKGRVLADRNTAFTVNAWGGANFGTELRLNNSCPSGNADCAFSLSGNLRGARGLGEGAPFSSSCRRG